MLGLPVQNQSHRAGTHLRGKLLRRIAHQTFFSGEMVSANPGAVQGVAIIEAEPSSEDILEPAPLISGRTSDSYFDRKIRMLVTEHDFEYYIMGTLQGQVSGGYIQIGS